MQEYINELQEQIDYHNQQISELNKDRDSFANALEQLENGELPEMTPDGKMKDVRLEAKLSEWEKKNGKIDRSDSAALVATIQAMDAEAAQRIQDHEQQRDINQKKINNLNHMAENGDIDGVRDTLEAFKNEHKDTVSEATISENEQVSQMAMEETTERAVNTGQNVAVSSKGSGFLAEFGSPDDQDTFSSARALEMTNEFTIVASGEIEMPTQEHTQDIAAPSMQININPMGG